MDNEMMTINPYLNFDGNALEALTFYQSVLGGELTPVVRLKDFPEMTRMEGVTEADHNRVMHTSLPIGEGYMLMASDIVPALGHTFKPGNNAYIHLEVESAEEADRIFHAFTRDGVVEMPMAEAAWAERFGCGADQFGVRWMISYTGNVDFNPGTGA